VQVAGVVLGDERSVAPEEERVDLEGQLLRIPRDVE
jgi:hypothetical protein